MKVFHNISIPRQIGPLLLTRYRKYLLNFHYQIARSEMSITIVTPWAPTSEISLEFLLSNSKKWNEYYQTPWAPTIKWERIEEYHRYIHTFEMSHHNHVHKFSVKKLVKHRYTHTFEYLTITASTSFPLRNSKNLSYTSKLENYKKNVWT